MVAISAIHVRVKTGDKGTNGRVYAGVGGREFALDTRQNDFRANSDKTFVLGASGNVKNDNDNDPREQAMDTTTLNDFPAYIRFEPSTGLDELVLDIASITVNPGANQVQFNAFYLTEIPTNVSQVTLGNDSGHFCYMRQGQAATFPTTTEIEQVEVRIKTATIGELAAPGTNGFVYLGLGGREFALDTENNDFIPGSDVVYTLGINSSVEKKQINNPNVPPLRTQELSVFPMYIRYEPRLGSNAWSIKQVVVTVNPGLGQLSFSPTFFTPRGNDRLILSQNTGKLCFLRLR